MRYHTARACAAVRPDGLLVEAAPRMNIKRLAIWFLLFSGLLIYVMLFERTDTPQPVAVMPAETYERVFPLETSDIIGVLVNDGEKTVRLTRDDEKMNVVEPAGAHASTDLINSLLNAIAGAVMIDELEPGKDETLYGLDPPTFTLKVYTNENAEPQTLLLGANAPSMVNLYASLPQQNRIVLLGTYLRFTLRTFLNNVK
jgi:hypothetical protein